MTVAIGTARRTRLPRAAAVVGVFVLAVLARMLPLLRGGGLSGSGSYDDSVYLASAIGWLHGRWPYRDFLFLQPPGIVVALAPFAAPAPLIGDAGVVAVARTAWIVLGGLTSVCLVRLLWRTSRSAAVVAGLFYAFFWPAGMVERVTDLEGLQNVLLVVALLLLRPFGTRQVRRWALLGAGAALGLAWSVKIWEVAPIVVLIGWLILRPQTRRRIGWFLGGIVAAVVAVCLPFFLAAPRAMWTMVVTDQVGRPWHAGWARRLAYITGSSHLVPISHVGAGLVVIVLATLLAAAPATDRSEVPVPHGRLARLVSRLPGCISYDEPSEALSLGLVSRDLARDCPFVVDLGAASRWTRLRPTATARSHPGNAVALSYLRRATATLLYRYLVGRHHGQAVAIIGHWETLAHDHDLRLVRPVSAGRKAG